jgi:hypothetical protein
MPHRPRCILANAIQHKLQGRAEVRRFVGKSGDLLHEPEELTLFAHMIFRMPALRNLLFEQRGSFFNALFQLITGSFQFLFGAPAHEG